MEEKIEINPNSGAFEYIDKIHYNSDFRSSPFGFAYKEYCDICKLEKQTIVYSYLLSCFGYPDVIIDIRDLCALAKLPSPKRMAIFRNQKKVITNTLNQIEESLQKDIREIVFCKMASTNKV